MTIVRLAATASDVTRFYGKHTLGQQMCDHVSSVSRACLQSNIFNMASDSAGRDVQLNGDFFG